MFPEALDEALAKRVDELRDVCIRSVSYTKVPKVVQADPSRRHFWLEDWHMTKVGRMLHDQDLCNYIPITYHQGPRITKNMKRWTWLLFKYLHLMHGVSLTWGLPTP